ncbi:hypothetical protein ROZALSC1DRAFT_26505, partial [Rozella allomycis CSF55]
TKCQPSSQFPIVTKNPPINKGVYLEELYLRKNNISDFLEILHLVPLKNLRILWLDENPIAYEKHYRKWVIGNLPWLRKLDGVYVTKEEVKESIELVEGMSKIRGDSETKTNRSLNHADKVLGTRQSWKKAEKLPAVCSYVFDKEVSQMLTKPSARTEESFVTTEKEDLLIGSDCKTNKIVKVTYIGLGHRQML